MPDRSLDSLSSAFLPLACALIARVTARGFAILVVQTSRTPEEHVANLNAGTSATPFSLHLPRRIRWQPGTPLEEADRDKADAIDLAPYEVYDAHGPDKVSWDVTHPAFAAIGEEAERLGLRWGGRWLRPRDPGHAELVLPWTERFLAEERARRFPVLAVDRPES
jgi:hypothetical protein